jgi:NADP-dependent 3-hydroxy acid dehydrogenase YdfG
MTASTTPLPKPAQVFDLTGRSAVVTGATGAFGEQAAYALAGAGAVVTLAGGNTEKLESVAAAIRDG